MQIDLISEDVGQHPAGRGKELEQSMQGMQQCAIADLAEPLQRNWATLTLLQRVQGKPSAPVAARLCGRQHHCGRAKTIWRAARKPPPGCFGDTSTRCQDDSGSGQPQHPGPRDEQTGDESSESAPIESATQVI